MAVVDMDVLSRVKELLRYQVLDSRRNQKFDKITTLAATVFDVPIAYVSFIDECRQWLRSSVGWGVLQAPKEESFCLHTVQGAQPFVVEDALLDPRFSSNRWVTGQGGVRFYAGAPLMTPSGVRLGALALMDRKPRTFTQTQIDILGGFSELVMREVQSHLNDLSLEDAVNLHEITMLASHEAIVVLDETLCVKSLNPAAEKAFLVRQRDVLGQTVDTLLPRRFKPACDELLAQMSSGLLLHGTPDKRQNLNGLRANGAEFPMSVTVAKVNLHDRINLVLMIRDLTADVTMENELRIAMSTSVKANTARDRFLASMSHELRTPLNAIIGFSEIMADEMLGPIGSDKYRAYATSIAASGWQLATMLGDMIDLAQVEQHPVVCRFESIDLAACAQAAVDELRPGIQEKSIRLLFDDVNVGDRKVTADPTLLQQIIVQLISNAINFSHEHGLVTIETQIRDYVKQVEIRIIDHGLGIDPTDLGRLGEPFFRGSTAIQNDVQGTGLGLAIGRRLAAAMGGSIELFGEPGRGATAILTLPNS